MKYLYEKALVCNLASAIPILIVLHTAKIELGVGTLIWGIVGQIVWAEVLEKIDRRRQP